MGLYNLLYLQSEWMNIHSWIFILSWIQIELIFCMLIHSVRKKLIVALGIHMVKYGCDLLGPGTLKICIIMFVLVNVAQSYLILHFSITCMLPLVILDFLQLILHAFFKTTNIGRLTFLLSFSRLEVHDKTTKNEGFQCPVTQLYWLKTHEIKSKCKLNLYFTFKIINIDNRSCRKLFFFFPSLTHFFITTTYQRFSTGHAQARKQSASAETCFSFKIKDRLILFELAGLLKDNLNKL